MTSISTAEACVQGLLQLNISKDFCLLVTASAFKHGSASYGGLDINCSLQKVLHFSHSCSCSVPPWGHCCEGKTIETWTCTCRSIRRTGSGDYGPVPHGKSTACVSPSPYMCWSTRQRPLLRQKLLSAVPITISVYSFPFKRSYIQIR